MFLKTTMKKISIIKVENRINKKFVAYKKNIENHVSNKHLIKLKFQQYFFLNKQCFHC